MFSGAFAQEDKKIKKVMTTFYITYEEASYLQKRARVQKGIRFSVVEHLQVVSLNELVLESRKRLLDEEASSQTDHIGPLVTLDPSIEWQLPIMNKRNFLVGECRKDWFQRHPR